MGIVESKDTTFLIGFGIAKQYCHPLSRIHIPMNEYSQIVGMPAFTSINSHLSGELSWRDDVKALAYTLIFLHSGSLPWLSWGHWGCLTGSSIQFLKESLGTGCLPEVPMELFNFFSYACGLIHAETRLQPPSKHPLLCNSVTGYCKEGNTSNLGCSSPTR